MSQDRSPSHLGNIGEVGFHPDDTEQNGLVVLQAWFRRFRLIELERELAELKAKCRCGASTQT
jgi:hypothetical protein